eukprot:747415-Hanusia_phi.AAC.9
MYGEVCERQNSADLFAEVQSLDPKIVDDAYGSTRLQGVTLHLLVCASTEQGKTTQYDSTVHTCCLRSLLRLSSSQVSLPGVYYNDLMLLTRLVQACRQG